MRRRTLKHGRTEQGASAVEFALVVPILAALLCGIIDYGLVFNDSVSTRNGIREAARQGVVSDFGSGATLATLKTQAKAEIGAITGTASVKIYVPGNKWERGAPLIVCASIPDPGVINFVPLPDNLRSRVEMSIETQTLPPTGALSSFDSGDWSWC